MSSLPDAERDACDVVEALAGLAALLAWPLPGDADRVERGPARGDGFSEAALNHARSTLLRLAEDGGEAAQRVLAYLRSLRSAGDGATVAVPPRLGPWREWVPPRGMVFGDLGGNPYRMGELPQPRRCDPGE